MLDWSLQQYGTGEASCSIHADNCQGKNKNRYLLGYFMWRVMTKQHDAIEYHMQIPGHARCLVDSSFAHIKIRYRSSDCETLEDVAAVVERSSHINTPVVYPQWCWRRWKPFLEEHFKSFPGIRQYQHFRFTSENPGVVIVSGNPTREEREVSIMRDPAFRFTDIQRPTVELAAGLSEQRRSYLQRVVSHTFVQPTEITFSDISYYLYNVYKKISGSNTELI